MSPNWDLIVAVQVSLLPLQLIAWYGLYAERRKMQMLLRFAVLRLQHAKK